MDLGMVGAFPGNLVMIYVVVVMLKYLSSFSEEVFGMLVLVCLILYC